MMKETPKIMVRRNLRITITQRVQITINPDYFGRKNFIKIDESCGWTYKNVDKETIGLKKKRY